jgi:uncharacterized protein YjbI with pentapeptide repeats
MALPIEAISAFFNVSSSSFLTVDPNALINNANQGIKGTPRFSSDTITLSAAAQALLAIRAQTAGTNAGRSNLIDTDFTGQDFTGIDLTGAVLNFANLSNANFSNAVLRDVSFANANLSGTIFFNADIRGANFAGVTGLTAEQLIGARVDPTTIFPIGVKLI